MSLQKLEPKASAIHKQVKQPTNQKLQCANAIGCHTLIHPEVSPLDDRICADAVQRCERGQSWWRIHILLYRLWMISWLENSILRLSLLHNLMWWRRGPRMTSHSPSKTVPQSGTSFPRRPIREYWKLVVFPEISYRNGRFGNSWGFQCDSMDSQRFSQRMWCLLPRI